MSPAPTTGSARNPRNRAASTVCRLPVLQVWDGYLQYPTIPKPPDQALLRETP